MPLITVHLAKRGNCFRLVELLNHFIPNGGQQKNSPKKLKVLFCKILKKEITAVRKDSAKLVSF